MCRIDSDYLKLLSDRYPNVECAVQAIVDMSSYLKLPKGTEYFFSDLHGESVAFIQLLRSASGVIRDKIDTVYAMTLSLEDREELARLITHPLSYLRAQRQKLDDDEKEYNVWSAMTIHRLIQVSREVASKYSGDRVVGAIDPKFVNIIDGLMLHDMNVSNKIGYYKELIDASIRSGIGDELIFAICRMVQQIAVDRLHVLGDIFDRGPRADLIMDELMSHRSVDIQWGNHDLDWIGAVAGNQVCICSVLRKGISYNNFDCLEDGYGINLRPLSAFAAEVYANDPCTAFQPHMLDTNYYDPVDTALASKMHKAIAIIMFKLEGQLIRRRPDYELDDRLLLDKMDLQRGIVVVDGKEYALTDTNFPTVDPKDPYALTQREREIIDSLTASFQHSDKLKRHIDFLVANGGIYKICNGNLLFHGCIPMNDDGTFAELEVDGQMFKGKALLDALDQRVRRAYYNSKNVDTDFYWYLWIGAKSPMFGKKKVTTFERYFTTEPELRVEPQNAYFELSRREDVAKMILREFGLDPDRGHIINGHMPVKHGDKPIRANGRVFVIDGGIAKSYHPTTGIAGYTLIYNSTVIKLAEHQPVLDEHGIQVATKTVTRVVETMPHQIMMSETDQGAEYSEKIEALNALIDMYRNGALRQRSEVR